jgi:hypothetical protein
MRFARSTHLVFVAVVASVSVARPAHAWPIIHPPTTPTCSQGSTDCAVDCRCCGADNGVEECSGAGLLPSWGTNGMHTGVDLSGSRGQTVFAPFSGVIRRARWNGGYGGTVLLESDDGSMSMLLGHLQCDSACSDSRIWTCCTTASTHPSACRTDGVCSDPEILRLIAGCLSITHESGFPHNYCDALSVDDGQPRWVGDAPRSPQHVVGGVTPLGVVGPKNRYQNGGFGSHVHVTARYGVTSYDGGSEVERCPQYDDTGAPLLAADGTIRTADHGGSWDFRGYTCALDGLCSFADPMAPLAVAGCTMHVGICDAAERCEEHDDNNEMMPRLHPDLNHIADDGLGVQACSSDGAAGWRPVCDSAAVGLRRTACAGTCPGSACDAATSPSGRIRSRYSAYLSTSCLPAGAACAFPCDNGGGAATHAWRGLHLEDFCDAVACPSSTRSWAIIDNAHPAAWADISSAPAAHLVRDGFWAAYKCARISATDGSTLMVGPDLLLAPLLDTPRVSWSVRQVHSLRNYASIPALRRVVCRLHPRSTYP